MLAESIASRNIGSDIGRLVDQPYVEGKCLSCARPSVPNTIFKEDAIEPKTGIKFPAFLEDGSSPSAEVFPFLQNHSFSYSGRIAFVSYVYRNFHFYSS